LGNISDLSPLLSVKLSFAGISFPSLSVVVKTSVPCGASTFAVGAGSAKAMHRVVVSIRVCYSDVTFS